MTSAHRIRLFGVPGVERGGSIHPLAAPPKALALIGYLARQEGPIRRAHLASLLWGETTDTRSRRNLTHTLGQISDLLPGCLQAGPLQVCWGSAGIAWTDVQAWQALIGLEVLAEGQPQQRAVPIDRLEQAASLYRGEFLAGLDLPSCAEFETWLVRERDHWRQQAIAALTALIRDHAHHGRHDQAEPFARRLVELEPWHEEGHQALMRLLAYSGRRGEALATYERLVRTLATELGVAPSDETRSLFERIRVGTWAHELGGKARQVMHADPAPAPAAVAVAAPRRLDWGDAPLADRFYGREAELATLGSLVSDEGCRIVSVLGMGGIGKTLLVAHFARSQNAGFATVIWRSLLNAPPLAELLRDLLAALAEEPPALTQASLDQQLALLLELLARRRCLLILDNCESILRAGERASVYRPGFEPYGQLLRRVGQGEHHSCLLLTSREQLPGLALLQTETPCVRQLELVGLSAEACHTLLAARGLSASREREHALAEHYSGSPLALQIVAETVRELYCGDLDTFLREGAPIFDDIRDVLDQQWGRLTPLEQDLLLWLAVEREPVTPAALRANLIGHVVGPGVLEALRSLRRRSLTEQRGEAFTLQNVVTEYVTQRLIDEIADELVNGWWRHFERHALIKAQSKEYVRETQVRLILAPLAVEVVARLGREGLVRRLEDGLAALRGRAERAPSYAGGNALNLLVHLGCDLEGFDFSRISVWQAYLQLARLQGANFAHADLGGSVFNDAFRPQNALAWSPDGRLLAAAAGEGVVHIWRLVDRQLTGIVRGGASYMNALAFSPDTGLLAGAGTEHVVYVWDVRSCQQVFTLQGNTDTIHALAWAPDGTTIFSGGADHTICAWRLADGRRVVIGAHNAEVQALALDASGTMLVSGGLDAHVCFWDLAAPSGPAPMTPVNRLPCAGPVHAVALHADGLLAAGCVGGIHMWDTHRAQPLMHLPLPNIFPRSLAFSPDGAWLASVGEPAIRIWSTQTWSLARVLQGHTHPSARVVWSPDGTRLASLAGDQIRLWELQAGQTVTVLRGYSDEVLSVSWSPDGLSVATSHTDERICVWDVPTWQVRHTLRGHQGWTRDVRFHSDGTTVISAGFDQTVRYWNQRTGQQNRVIRGHTALIDCLALSPDGARLATGSYDQTVWLWDTATCQVSHVLRGHTGTVAALAFSPDGRMLASGGADGAIRLWDVAAGKTLSVLDGDQKTIFALVFDQTGQVLASGGDDRTIRLWDTLTGRQVRTLSGHRTVVCELWLSPDGTVLASCGAGDQTVRLWDLASGLPLQVLRHGSWVVSCAFSPDGATLISGSEDGRLRLWDVATGELLRVWRAPGPYAGMNITGVTGITDAQQAGLRALGAVGQ